VSGSTNCKNDSGLSITPSSSESKNPTSTFLLLIYPSASLYSLVICQGKSTVNGAALSGVLLIESKLILSLIT
jgi:hypothetical protein